MTLQGNAMCHVVGSKGWWRSIVFLKDRLLDIGKTLFIKLWTGRCPPAEKAILHYAWIRHLSFSGQPMEKLIKIYARHLADIDDIIWDNREDEIACDIGK